MEPWETAIVLACVVGCLAAALHGLWLLAGWVAATGELRSWRGKECQLCSRVLLASGAWHAACRALSLPD